MFAINNGNGTYALGSVPFVNDLPVTASNPMPITQAVAPLAYIGANAATVHTTSGTLIPVGSFTRTFTISTLPGSPGNIWLNPTGPAAASTWGFVPANGGSFTFGTEAFPLPTTPLMALTDGGGDQVVTIAGG